MVKQLEDLITKLNTAQRLARLALNAYERGRHDEMTAALIECQNSTEEAYVYASTIPTRPNESRN